MSRYEELAEASRGNGDEAQDVRAVLYQISYHALPDIAALCKAASVHACWNSARGIDDDDLTAAVEALWESTPHDSRPGDEAWRPIGHHPRSPLPQCFDGCSTTIHEREEMTMAVWRPPVCVGCGRRPDEILEYVQAVEDPQCLYGTAEAYVIGEEGTLNLDNGHFWCTECYINHGMPLGVAP